MMYMYWRLTDIPCFHLLTLLPAFFCAIWLAAHHLSCHGGAMPLSSLQTARKMSPTSYLSVSLPKAWQDFVCSAVFLDTGECIHMHCFLPARAQPGLSVLHNNMAGCLQVPVLYSNMAGCLQVPVLYSNMAGCLQVPVLYSNVMGCLQVPILYSNMTGCLQVSVLYSNVWCTVALHACMCAVNVVYIFVGGGGSVEMGHSALSVSLSVSLSFKEKERKDAQAKREKEAQ